MNIETQSLEDIKFTLPAYPQYPASLSTAITFYNAARSEINERVKFRDQVLLTVIGATFAFLGFMEILEIGPDNVILPGEHFRLAGHIFQYFISVGGVSILVYFLAIYNGYQNAKIAELGLFITSGPAKHLMLYGNHELAGNISYKASRSSLASEIIKAHDQLRKTMSHWDGWAATGLDKADPEFSLCLEAINKEKDSFSQDNLYELLLVNMAYIPVIITLSFLFNNEGAMVKSFVILFTDYGWNSPSSAFDFFLYLISIFLILIILFGLPIAVKKRVRAAKKLKDKYSELRRKSY